MERRERERERERSEVKGRSRSSFPRGPAGRRAGSPGLPPVRSPPFACDSPVPRASERRPRSSCDCMWPFFTDTDREPRSIRPRARAILAQQIFCGGATAKCLRRQCRAAQARSLSLCNCMRPSIPKANRSSTGEPGPRRARTFVLCISTHALLLQLVAERFCSV